MKPKSEPNNKPTMENKVLPPSLIKRLSDSIRSYPSIKSLYYLGATEIREESWFFVPGSVKSDKKIRHEVFLLVISDKSLGDPLRFREVIQAEMAEEVKIFSIHYTVENLESQLIEYPFLYHLLLPQNRIWSDIEWAPELIKTKMPLDWHIKEWEHRMLRAIFFFGKAAFDGEEIDETSRLAFISEALSQASAALLWAKWQWKPPTMDLDLLLNLSKSFSSIPDIVLPENSFQSKRMYHLLCHAPFIMLHNLDLLISSDENDYIHSVAKEFLREVNFFGEKTIWSMGKENYRTPIDRNTYGIEGFQGKSS